MVSLVWRRGFSSQRHAIEDAEAGTSERPWMVTRMPPMVMVCEEMGGVEAFVPWRGFVVAAILLGDLER
jgi:hypothetical protein